MALTDIHQAGPASARTNGCGICKWLITLPADDRKIAKGMIADDSWPTMTLHKALAGDPDVVAYTPRSEKPLETHRSRMAQKGTGCHSNA